MRWEGAEDIVQSVFATFFRRITDGSCLIAENGTAWEVYQVSPATQFARRQPIIDGKTRRRLDDRWMGSLPIFDPPSATSIAKLFTMKRPYATSSINCLPGTGSRSSY